MLFQVGPCVALVPSLAPLISRILSGSMPSSRASSSMQLSTPKGADRRTRRTIGGNFRAIAENVVADRLGVRQVVDCKPADAALLHRRTWKCPRLVLENGLGGGNPTILLGAHLDFNDGTRGRSGRPE